MVSGWNEYSFTINCISTLLQEKGFLSNDNSEESSTVALEQNFVSCLVQGWKP